MTEDDIAKLFKAASSLGEKYGIDLLGAESIVGLCGVEGNEDIRVSDSEHVIHELTHCALRGLEFTPDVMEALSAVQKTKTREDLCMNEIETFSVVMGVMRRWRIDFDRLDFVVQLEVQLHGFEAPEGFDLWGTFDGFYLFNERGQRAVDTIDELLKKELQ
jgi:hypothetical protein